MDSNPSSVEFHPDLPRPAVLCTIVRILGSAPQQTGAKMWVGPDRAIGTIGGGNLEHKALAEARRMLKAADAEPQVQEFRLDKEAGQVCGGKALVFFEPVARRRAVHLFGGGHVGRAAAWVFAQMPFDLHVIDSRPEWAAREGLPAEAAAHCMEPLAYARSRKWTADDAVCIFTHSHEVDFPVARHFLRQPVGYLGAIGSKNKSREFRMRLGRGKAGAALQKLWDAKMHCPIGIPLNSKNPKVIAVSVAAQVLQEWGLKAG